MTRIQRIRQKPVEEPRISRATRMEQLTMFCPLLIRDLRAIRGCLSRESGTRNFDNSCPGRPSIGCSQTCTFDTIRIGFKCTRGSWSARSACGPRCLPANGANQKSVACRCRSVLVRAECPLAGASGPLGADHRAASLLEQFAGGADKVNNGSAAFLVLLAAQSAL
jgi:hypothetical protein